MTVKHHPGFPVEKVILYAMTGAAHSWRTADGDFRVWFQEDCFIVKGRRGSAQRFDEEEFALGFAHDRFFPILPGDE